MVLESGTNTYMQLFWHSFKINSNKSYHFLFKTKTVLTMQHAKKNPGSTQWENSCVSEFKVLLDIKILRTCLGLDLKLQWTVFCLWVLILSFNHLQCSKPVVAAFFCLNAKMQLWAKKKTNIIWKKKYEDCQLLLYHVFDKQFVTVIISRTCVYMKIYLSFSNTCLRTC